MGSFQKLTSEKSPSLCVAWLLLFFNGADVLLFFAGAFESAFFSSMVLVEVGSCPSVSELEAAVY